MCKIANLQYKSTIKVTFLATKPICTNAKAYKSSYYSMIHTASKLTHSKGINTNTNGKGKKVISIPEDLGV